MNTRYFIYAILSFVLFTQCKDSATTSISGNLLNATDVKVSLEQKTLRALVPVGDTLLQKGKFKLDFAEGIEAGLYTLKIGNQRVDLVLNGTEKKISLNGDFNDLAKNEYILSGSSMSETYNNTIKDLKTGKIKAPELKALAKTADPLLGAAYTLGVPPIDPSNFEEYLGISKKLSEAYPNTSFASDFSSFANDTKKSHEKKMSQYKVKVGQMAPDIALSDPDGKEMKLSDLKGKVVLLDFWSSWCGPCRRANPKVVKTYKKLKDKGFTVFSVSLDGVKSRDKQRLKTEEAINKKVEGERLKWVRAIEQDKLEWDTHVSALQHWECPAGRQYGVTSIPTTFLIDKEGKIAKINPKANLEAEVLKLI